MPNDRDPCEHPQLDRFFMYWERYHRVGGTKHLAAKTQTFWSSGSRDFDSMADNNEMKFALMFETLVWDLVPIERTAVFHKHLAAVWITHREPMEEVYARARMSLSDAMRAKGVA